MKHLDNEVIGTIKEFLKQYDSLFDYDFYSDTEIIYDYVTVHATPKSGEQGSCLMFRYSTNNEFKEVQISNIFVPHELRYNGIGKKMILITAYVASKYNYETYVVQLVESFRENLLKRGAIQGAVHDTLLITGNTNLI